LQSKALRWKKFRQMKNIPVAPQKFLQHKLAPILHSHFLYCSNFTVNRVDSASYTLSIQLISPEYSLDNKVWFAAFPYLSGNLQDIGFFLQRVYSYTSIVSHLVVEYLFIPSKSFRDTDSWSSLFFNQN
jgi:hypothetical protein